MAKKMRSNNPAPASELHHLAEKHQKINHQSRPAVFSSPEEMTRILDELETHRIELEVEQAELARTRSELEESLRMYTELYDFAPTGYLTLGRDGRILKANLAATKLLGVDQTRLLGLHFISFVVPADYRVMDDLLETVFSRRVPGNCEVKLFASPAQPSAIHRVLDRTMRIDAEVIDTSHGCRVILTDITEQKMVEERLRKSERNFRSIVNQISEMVFVTNDIGTITYVSPVIQNMFGFLPGEVIGTNYFDYIDNDAIPAAKEVFNTTLLNKLTNQVFEIKVKRKDTSLIEAEIHLQYYQDEDQTGLIGLIWDISERKSRERIRWHFEEKLLENQQLLESIFNDVNVSVFVVDVLPDGIYRYKKHGALNTKLSSIIHVDFSGKTPEEAFESESAKAIHGNYDACVRAGISIQYVEFLPFLGKDMWWETVLNPVRDASGRIFRIIGTTTDITERRLATLKAQEISARYEATINAAQLGTWDWNFQTGEAIVNNRCLDILGYTPEELAPLTNQTWIDLIHPDDLRQSRAIAERHFKGELDYYKCECRLKHKHGYWVWVLDQGSLMSRTADGKPWRMLGTQIDITDRKLAESQLQVTLTELRVAKEKAEESDRLKTAFLANISHEIRTPMNGILGFSELLKDPHLSGDEKEEFIGLINQSGQRMLNLINDLIDISRIDAKEATLNMTKTSLNTLLRDLYAFFKPEAIKKGLRLTFTQGLPDNESWITTDSARLHQILTNLIKNALKFTTKGGIDFGYTKKDDVLEFYVIDSGIGIPANKKERIFERFHQVNNSLTRDHEGSGLGLAITKAFIELLGGSIQVKSVDGAGSTFTFTLPSGTLLNSDNSHP